ncbi:MAG: hypothetical protein HYX75_21040 [Acidobacteria bacterium]|nr:hypothetical protein [Acidobacteriota bacterium]
MTILLKNVSVRTAMTAVGESIGCTWRFSDGKLVFTAIPGATKGPRAPRGGSGGPAQPSDTEARLENLLSAPLTLDLNDAPIENTFQLMAEILGGTLEMDESLRGKMITIESTGHPTRDLLDRLCHMAECRWELVPRTVPIFRIRKP